MCFFLSYEAIIFKVPAFSLQSRYLISEQKSSSMSSRAITQAYAHASPRFLGSINLRKRGWEGVGAGGGASARSRWGRSLPFLLYWYLHRSLFPSIITHSPIPVCSHPSSHLPFTVRHSTAAGLATRIELNRLFDFFFSFLSAWNFVDRIGRNCS